MKKKSEEIFASVYSKPPEITLLSPGRINLIGEHVDYYGGLVMPAAINKYIVLSIAKSTNQYSSVYSSNYDEKIVLDAQNLPIQTGSNWVKYLNTALEVVRESGFKSMTFDLTIISNLPTGAGLSSSAALVTGFIEIVSVLNEWNISYEKIALIAQTTEHRLGTPCGLMDQYASLFGKQDAFILLDCSTLKFRDVKVNLSNYILRLYNTRVHHALTDGGYAIRRKQGEAALEELKSFYSKPGSYRDFTIQELNDMPQFDAIQYKRARHAISEINRVGEFEKAILSNDLDTAGGILYATHHSLKNDYEVSCEEADYIVNVCKMEGVAGARIMGGGFGGCVLCLLEQKYEANFKEKLMKAYKNKFGFFPEAIEFLLGERSIH